MSKSIGWESTLNELVSDTEQMLKNSTTESMLQSVVQFATLDADDVLTMSHVDRTLLLGMATLAMAYMIHRRYQVEDNR